MKAKTDSRTLITPPPKVFSAGSRTSSITGGTGGGVGFEGFRERLAAYLTHYNETGIKEAAGAG